MKKDLLILCLLILSTSAICAQNIRGSIRDIDSEIPLTGVHIMCVSSSDTLYAVSEIDGSFRLMDVSAGRVNLQVSYIGYEHKVLPNILVHSAKETIVQIGLEESVIVMNEIAIVARKEKGETNDPMALLSARSISPEESSRYAGGFNDPSRIVANFAGVTATQDGGNDIIIRGNSPKYIQWRLEGMQITNPNHFGDQSTVGGSISTLNNNIIDNSDFHTGAFNAEYGDVLSGIYDVKLRNGNNEKLEAVAGVGLIGLNKLYARFAGKWHKSVLRLGYMNAYESLIRVYKEKGGDATDHTLDVGTGTGVLAMTYVKSFPEVKQLLLLDASSEMLQEASTNLSHASCNIELINGLLGTPHIQPSSIDTLLCAHVIEHTPDPLDSLKWFYHVLQTNGTLLLSASKPHWCTSLVRWRWGHKAFRPQDVYDMLNEAGFTDVEIIPYSSGPPSRMSCGFYAKKPTTPHG